MDDAVPGSLRVLIADADDERGRRLASGVSSTGESTTATAVLTVEEMRTALAAHVWDAVVLVRPAAAAWTPGDVRAVRPALPVVVATERPAAALSEDATEVVGLDAVRDGAAAVVRHRVESAVTRASRGRDDAALLGGVERLARRALDRRTPDALLDDATALAVDRCGAVAAVALSRDGPESPFRPTATAGWTPPDDAGASPDWDVVGDVSASSTVVADVGADRGEATPPVPPGVDADAVVTAPLDQTHPVADVLVVYFAGPDAPTTAAVQFVRIAADVVAAARRQTDHDRRLQRYEEIIENLPVGVYRNTPGPDGEFVEVNPALADIFDAASPVDLLERPVSDLYPARDERAAFSRRLSRSGIVEDVERPMRTLEGEEVWVSITAIETTVDGEVYYDGIVEDVTERRRREEALQHLQQITDLHRDINQAIARADSRTAIEESVCGRLAEFDSFQFAWIGHCDQRRNVIEPSTAAGDGTDYLEEVSVGVEGDHGEGPTGRAVRTHSLAVVDDIATDEDYAPWRDPALERGFRSSAAVPLRYESDLYGVLNVYAAEPTAFSAHDRRMLSELGQTLPYAIDAVEARQDTTRLLEAVEHAGHAVLITDRDGTIRYVNPAFESLTGYSEAEVTGTNPRILQSGVHDDAYFERLWDTILDGRIWEEEITNRRKSGELYTARQTIAPIVDDGIRGFVAIQSDITDQRVQKQRIDVLHRVLRHNLRNVVNIVEGNVEVLLADEEDVPREPLRTIREQARRLTELSETAETARRALERAQETSATTDLARVRRRLDDRLGSLSGGSAVDVDVEVPTDAAVRVDEAVVPAVLELVENAVVHAGDGPTDPRLSVAVDEETAVFRVADGGPGLPPQERAILRGEGETPIEHGTGIGLWLVYWLVTSAGGTVSVEDNDPSGTVVVVRTPIRDPEE